MSRPTAADREADKVRKGPANFVGCKPLDDEVCLAHDTLLVCSHGCDEAKPHECKDKND